MPMFPSGTKSDFYIIARKDADDRFKLFDASIIASGAFAELIERINNDPSHEYNILHTISLDDLVDASGVLRTDIDQNHLDFLNSSGIFVKNGENLGTGSQVFIQKDAQRNLEFRTLIGGSGVEITTSGNTIRFDNELSDDFDKLNTDWENASGAFIKTASNQGIGKDVFAQKVGQDLQFRRLLQGSGIIITPSGNTLRVDNMLVDDLILTDIRLDDLRTDFDNASGIWVKNGENLGTGKQIFVQKDSDKNLEFRTLIGGSGIEISTSGNTLRFDNEIIDDFNELQNDFASASGNFVKTASNVGSSGIGIFKQKVGSDLQFKKLVDGSGISLIESDNSIRIYNQEEIVVKHTSESTASDTTLSNDAELKFPVKANGVYVFEVHLMIQAISTAPDIKLGWSVPAGTTMLWAPIIHDNTQMYWSTTKVSDTPQFLFSEATVHIFATGVGTIGCYLRGTIFVSSTAGTVFLQWAQNSSNITSITVRRGSFIKFRKLI